MIRTGFLVLLLFPVPLAAQPAATDGRVERLVTAAEELAHDGDWDGASRLFRKAYDLAPDPMHLYNIGWCQDKKGDLARAREAYEQYLAVEKDPEGLARGRRKLDGVLDRIPGSLRVVTEPAGASVDVDGKPAGASPATIPGLVRGKHDVVVRRDGYEPALRTVTVEPGAEASVTLTLIPGPVPVPPPVPGPGVEASVTPALEPGPVPAALPVPETVVSAPASRFPWHWVALGAGAATLAGGGVMTWLASRDRSKVTDASWTTNGTEKVYTGLTRTRARSLWSSAKTKDTVAYALYGVGGAAVVTGVVMWLTSGSDRLTTTAVPIPGGAVVGACGSF